MGTNITFSPGVTQLATKAVCKVAILENYALFSSGIKSLLKETKEFEIVAEARNAYELLPFMEEERPDVLIMDIIHCENAGIKQLKKIRRKFPGIPILLITSHDFADCFEEHLRIGVKGFVFKDDSSSELVRAVKKLFGGEEYFCHCNSKGFKTPDRHKSDQSAIKWESILTDREVSVLKLFCRGFSYKEIAASLFISPRTVETHKKNILSKLKVGSTAEMVKYAFHKQILS
jgi:DNA-binding NarL/FixJ family response regulator